MENDTTNGNKLKKKQKKSEINQAQKNRYTTIASIAAGFFIFAIACATEPQKKELMNTHHATLWQLINILSDIPFFTLENAKSLFHIDFIGSHSTAYFSVYEGGPVFLANQITIEKIELRINNKDGAGGLMMLGIGGVCVTLDDVYAHYPNIVLAETPRGQSLNEATFYSIQQPREKLSFGFKEYNPDCLVMVVFNRIERE